MYYRSTCLAGQHHAKRFLYSAILLLATTTSAVTNKVYAQLLIPTDSATPFYYQLGGGRDVSFPATDESSSINLDASLSIHAGYQCGIFNPAISLRTTLNQLHEAFKNAEKAAVQNATAAIAEFPMYELARVNPTLYNILNNNLLHAHAQIRLATKSCESMQAAIANGKNPYKDWATLAVGHQWEKHIGLALDEDEHYGDDDDIGSITSAKADIDAHSGEAGLPWVQGKQEGNSGKLVAGGQSQPPIQLIHDTVIAGYKVLHPVQQANNTGHLAHVWPTAEAAALWAVNVLGDQVISTCNKPDCKKSTVVGHGLLPLLTQCPNAISTSTTQAIPITCAHALAITLHDMVQSKVAITREQLTRLSTPTLAISPVIIQALRTLSPVPQALLIDKLAQAIALQTIIDKALLMRRLLLTGVQVPLIASNGPATEAIYQAVRRLEKDVDALLWEKRIRQQTLVTPLQKLLQYTASKQNALIPAINQPPSAVLKQGALATASPHHE